MISFKVLKDQKKKQRNLRTVSSEILADIHNMKQERVL